MRFIIFFIVGFLVSFIVAGQNVYSWEQCVEYALINNFDVKIQEINNRQQQLNVNDAKYRFLPGIGGSISFTQSSGNSIDPNTNAITNQDFFNNNYGIGASISLFQGFSRINRLKFEKYNLMYTEKSVEYQKNTVAFNVLEMFINVLFYKGMKEIAAEQADISKQALIRNKKMFELGRISESEVIELEAQLANDSLNAIQMEMMYTLNLVALKNTMNYPLYDTLLLGEIEIYEMLARETSNSVEEIMESAKRNLPQIQFLEFSLKAAQIRLAEMKGYALPSVSLGSSWGTNYSTTTKDNSGNITTFSNQFKGKSGNSINLTVSIPIFSRLSNYSSIKKAGLNCELAQVQYNKEIAENEYIIYNNIFELDASQKEYDASVKNKEKQQIAFETANKKLEKGLIDLIGYNTVKNLNAQAKTELLRSELELFLRAKTIQFYLTGKIL